MSFTPPYKYITASELAEKVKQADPQQVQVIDVRDDDFVGGNIVGAKNSPSNAFYDNVKELVEENKDSEFEVSGRGKGCGLREVYEVVNRIEKTMVFRMFILGRIGEI